MTTSLNDKHIEAISMSCFLNALLREWAGWHLIDTPLIFRTDDQPNEKSICIPIRHDPSDDSYIIIKLAHFSDVKCHKFTYPPYLVRGSLQESGEALSFMALSEMIINSSEVGSCVSPEQRQRFLSRVLNSYENMLCAFQVREQDLTSIYNDTPTFISAEQALLVGHSVHPTPKNRDQFNPAENMIFAPEFSQAWSLRWFAAAPEVIHKRSAQADTFLLSKQMFEEDHQVSPPILPDDWVLLPIHPWQAQHILERHEIKAYIERGLLKEIGEGEKQWRSTSSLRTAFSPNADYMPKFSLSVRLTNSVRHLLPHEVERGVEICKVLDSPIGKAMKSRYPNFSVLLEPAYFAFKDFDGNMIDETIVAFRQNSFKHNSKDISVLATLTQEGPGTTKSLLANLITKHAAISGVPIHEFSLLWFKAFLSVAIEPLVISQADYGILFGAHQQNIVLTFSDGLPEKMYFRDCQGSGYSNLGYALLNEHINDIGTQTENVIDQEKANRLFTYYLIVNSLFGVIGSIACEKIIDENILLETARLFLVEIRARKLKDKSCLNYILYSDEIWHKGNFFCSLKDINENTSADPLAIYFPMKNPLYIRSDCKNSSSDIPLAQMI